MGGHRLLKSRGGPDAARPTSLGEGLGCRDGRIARTRDHLVTARRRSARREDGDLLGDSPFDIVITDYAMPCMNGFALAQRIRERRPDLPIILATGYAELPADRSIQFGLLSKPYTSRDLTVALEKAVALGW